MAEAERPAWTVGFDNDRCMTLFDSEQDAIDFAHIDSQLESVAAVVLRHNPDGTVTVVAEFPREALDG